MISKKSQERESIHLKGVFGKRICIATIKEPARIVNTKAIPSAFFSYVSFRGLALYLGLTMTRSDDDELPRTGSSTKMSSAG